MRHELYEIPEHVLLDLSAERVVQRGRWGDEHDDVQDDHHWMTVITYHLGRAAWKILTHRTTPTDEAAIRHVPEPLGELRTELIKISTTVISWIEAIDRRESHGT